MMPPDHHGDRDELVRLLREEFLGPAPYGPQVDSRRGISIETTQQSYGPYRDFDGEEILCWENPVTRYGVGVLFPALAASDSAAAEAPSTSEETQEDEAKSLADAPDAVMDDRAREALAKLADKTSGVAEEDDADPNLIAANRRRPSSMGISFLVELSDGVDLVVRASGGRYHAIKVTVPGRGQDRRWFARKPWSLTTVFAGDAVRATDRGKVEPATVTAEGLEDLDVGIELFARLEAGRSLVTVTLINRTEGSASIDEQSLFQCCFHVTAVSGEGARREILPYPGPQFSRLEDEEQSLGLLYRKWQTFAVGHGCAADWVASEGDERALGVKAEPLPSFETPSITPDVTAADGRPLKIPMAPLAGLVDGEDGRAEIERLLKDYDAWIQLRAAEAAVLPDQFRMVAATHLRKCTEALARMRAGVALLNRDSKVALAFQLANQAILLQQLRSEREPRLILGRKAGGGYSFSREVSRFDVKAPPGDRGSWRAFQLAFLLMTLESTANGRSSDRELVELIWFPTGGGKTEAYLGLTAFALFIRRLRDPSDNGVHVITRYTLRLLTTQQFQRAMSLICAMEDIRDSRQAELGTERFTIGIWLGSATTPNRRSVALQALTKLQKDADSDNPFLVTRCPWCAAQIGPIRKVTGLPRVVGYEQRGDTVQIYCPDSTCKFRGGLPVWVIDEDIYDNRPSLLIGTVDKFAAIAWTPRSRSLFGIDNQGRRIQSPPGLIIQDELHLISGPLGSMVGLYELAIHELCTDRRDGVVIPKIITSTATIRRYQDQLRSLFARERVALFPPVGVDIADSFFGRYATIDGKRAPGRLYLGIHATNHGSLITTQVQGMAALLQAPLKFEPSRRDPWWTLMVFFNTLRDLGTSLSLLQSNIPMHQKAIANRQRTEGKADLRRFYEPLELTSRMGNDEVPRAITSLEVATTSTLGRPVDVCLASNIIEVGIDIDRLSLMVVVGQPKTTSQYIQVTGRIGRRWWERPGLVATLMNPARPRDRSHYERFRAYHERLYAQVEPTSVTPFAPPAVERALHAALAAFIRQTGDEAVVERPVEVPQVFLDKFRRLTRERVRIVDPSEVENVDKVISRRIDELRRWGKMRWGTFGDTDPDATMLTVPESEIEGTLTTFSWPTPLSMRNVDAECELEVTMRYVAPT